jgi:hypothetical protein
LPFVTGLPGIDARPPGPVTIPMRPPSQTADHLPTHLVLDGVAHAIGAQPLALSADGIGAAAETGSEVATVRRLAGQAVIEAPATAGVTVNGDAFEGQAGLAAGDRLGFVASDLEILVVTLAE